MTDDWRKELIEKMARKIAMSRYKFADFDIAAREALSIAEPVIREQCAEAAAAIAKEHLTDTVAAIVAAAIREGG